VSRTVLIADDVAFFRAALQDILSKGDYEVIGEAANGADALDKARELSPDLVILDVVMPEMNGIEALKEIVKLNIPVKVIMCSSLGYEAIVEAAMKEGACGYIIKPLNEKKVLNTLDHLLTLNP